MRIQKVLLTLLQGELMTNSNNVRNMSIDEMAEQSWHEIDIPVDSREWKMLKKLSQDDYGVAVDLYLKGFRQGVMFKLTGEIHDN